MSAHLPASQPLPLLLKLLFGETSPVSLQQVSPRLLLWAGAFQDWLDDIRSRDEFLYRDSLRYWKRLLELVNRPPWDISPSHLASFRTHLETQGLAPATVVKHLCCIHSFYRWVNRLDLDPLCEPGFNPVAGLPRPYVKPYASARMLTPAEASAFLSVFEQDPSLLSKRDYAFFLARLNLGVPYQYLQKLRWEQLQFLPNGVWVDWGPAKTPTRLPDPIAHAILSYLVLSGRLNPAISLFPSPASYIFAPQDSRLPKGPTGCPADWVDSRYVDRHTLLRIIKLYGSRLGIPAPRLVLPAFRYTAAAAYLAASPTLAEMNAFLGSPGLSNTKLFLRFLKRIQQASLLSHDPPLQPLPLPIRQRTRLQPGDQIKHGFFARAHHPDQLAEIIAQDRRDMALESQGLQQLMSNLLERQEHAPDTPSLTRLMQAFLVAASCQSDLEKMAGPALDEDQGDRFIIAGFQNIKRALKDSTPFDVDAFYRQAAAFNLGGESAASQRSQAIAGVRLVLSRLLTLALSAPDDHQLAIAAELYCRACQRLARLLKEYNRSTHLRPYFDALIEDALRDLYQEWQLTPIPKVSERSSGP
jgi:hypothetical protein